MTQPKQNRSLRVPAILCALLLTLTLACGIYLGDYYHADTEAIAAFSPTVEILTKENGHLVFQPENAHAGLIFYPGGKVEHTAYIPLMQALASRGILCVLVEMPFRLAVLDINAADDIPAHYPQIQSWYIGGHSLGGSMAAAYLADHADAFDGLVLLGAYSTADLSAIPLKVLSLYGSEDTVMNREKYEENRKNLPANFTETILEGGCHAYFGMYGPQDGDGTPIISNETQIHLTADAIASLTAPQVVNTIEANLNAEPLPIFVTHYEMSDGTWHTDSHTYAHRLELTGRLPSAAADTTFIFLSNIPISFDQAWKAAGLSSNLDDYFTPEEAVLVAFGTHAPS